RLDLCRIEFNLEFHILRDGTQRAAKLSHQHLPRFLNIVNVSGVAVTFVGEDHHARIFVIAHSKSQHGQIDAFLTFFFYETFHGSVAGFTDIKVTISCQDDPVIAAFLEVLLCNAVSKSKAFTTRGRTAGFQSFKRVKYRALVAAGRRVEDHSSGTRVHDDRYAVLFAQLIRKQFERRLEQRKFVEIG